MSKLLHELITVKLIIQISSLELFSGYAQLSIDILIRLNKEEISEQQDSVKPYKINRIYCLPLLDALMPVMNGFECCPELRKLLPLTPIIFMTGLTETENIVNAFDVGVTDYISKPIDPEELLARIKRHCQNANDINNARDALDIARQYVLAVNMEGKLLWATPEAEQIINTAGEWTDVKTQLQRWIKQANKTLELDVQVNENALTFRYFKKQTTTHICYTLYNRKSYSMPKPLKRCYHSLSERRKFYYG